MDTCFYIRTHNSTLPTNTHHRQSIQVPMG